MYKLLTLLLFLPCLSQAVTPADGSTLNYRIVGFSEPGLGRCTLQVASGKYTDEAAFSQHIIISQPCTGGKTVAELPAFGTQYTWRMEGDKTRTLHHFSTLPFIFDTTNDVMRIISNTGKYNGYYFFVDATRTLYDMQGRPVWFLPDADFVARSKPGLRDLKASPAGTITYLMGSTATEVDYNGNHLLSTRGSGAVSHDTAENFHRELTRLANGHYMVLGNERVAWALPYYKAGSERNDSITKDKDDTFRHHMEFGTVVEYDQAGKVVWQWHSAPYFRTSDLFDHFAANGKFPVTSDVHENAFFFDEKKKMLYVGFRNISRILKIKYPEGKVVAVYGPIYKPGMGELRNDLFCGQHTIGMTPEGDLYLYNNNSASFTSLPQLLVLREPKDGSHNLQKLWEYDCTLEGMNDLEKDTYTQITNQLQADSRGSALASAIYVSTGGNAIELPGGAFFVSMSGLFAKLMIVNKNKEVLWSAAPETRLHAHGPFTFIASYRASILSRRELEKMIWAAK